MSEEIGELFESMTNIFNESFSQIKNRLQEMESNIVKKKDDIINKPNSNKERKHDSSYEKLQ